MLAETWGYLDSIDIFKQMMPNQVSFGQLEVAAILDFDVKGIRSRATDHAKLLKQMLLAQPYPQGPSFIEGVPQLRVQGYMNPAEHAEHFLLPGHRQPAELLLIIQEQPLSLAVTSCLKLFDRIELKALAMMLGVLSQ